MTALPEHAHPILLAPMAGGAGTPALVAAVAGGGGFGQLAAGYLGVEALAQQIAAVRALSGHPFGVNLFVPEVIEPIDLSGYAEGLRPLADRFGVEPGIPDWADTDHYGDKIDLLVADPVSVVSFTFGLPSPDDVRRLHGVGSALVATATTVEEAQAVVERGLDAICVQGPEAGGHRGTHRIADTPSDQSLDELLGAVRAAVDLPLIAAGGISCGAEVARVLQAGAYAAQLGTLFLRSSESGASATHQRALTSTRGTTITRAFTGRPARALHNAFIDANEPNVPPAYPQVHHVTAPLRRAAAAAGDPEVVHLWAGTGHRRAEDRPAADILIGLVAELLAAQAP